MRETVNRRATDPQTGLWTEEWLERKMEDYFSGGSSGRGSLCLIEMTGWELRKEQDGPEEAQPVLKKFAFFLRQSLRTTDVAARVGERYFAVFLPGCKSRREVEERLSFLSRNLDMSMDGTDGIMAAGAVICHGPDFVYREMVRKAKGALHRAGELCSHLCVVNQEEAFTEEETDWEMEAARQGGPVKNDADMDFVGTMVEFLLFPENYPPDVEGCLEELGRYFGADMAYVVEKCVEEKGYEISMIWQKEKSLVMNYNLNRLPEVIGNRYGKRFDREGLFVCSTMDSLKELEPVMAQRQRLRGTRSMMQCAILENGNYIGYITVADTRRERLWTSRETATFSMAGRILASSLLENRSRRILETITARDMLTEAWNYNRFLLQGGERLHTVEALQAIVTVDIKNFKAINTQYGYEEGDEILKQMRSLFNYFTRGNECYARIEADKFVLLLEYNSLNGLQQRINQLMRRIEQIPENRLGVSCACAAGVCLVEQGDQNMSLLVDHANMARNSLKDYHKSAYSFYNKEAEQKLIRERELTLRMKSAAENEEFVVYYQPRIGLKQKKIVGLEALVRWKTGEGTLISPDDFIPLFEKNGFITELDLYVFERVCRQLKLWMESGHKLIPIGVNISRVHIKEPDFLTKLIALCERYGIAPQHMELEITESAFLHNQDIVMAVAVEIKKAGFALSMDDFGTGYSSLSLLKDLPVDIVKLDKEFFQKQANPRERIIVTNVIRMAKQLGIQVVSEGIETRESEEFLNEIECEFAQGYLYSRPVPMETIEELLAAEDEESV